VLFLRLSFTTVKELVRLPVIVIATAGVEPSALAAKAATSTIPIVFGVGSVGPRPVIDEGLARLLRRLQCWRHFRCSVGEPYIAIIANAVFRMSTTGGSRSLSWHPVPIGKAI
jgi:hypothetical protein